MLRARTIVAALFVSVIGTPGAWAADAVVRVGFGVTDITPTVSEDAPPVWIAGYRQGRRATGVHDTLHARAVVIDDGQTKIALVSVDLIGLMYPAVKRVREALAGDGFGHVTVASTHNHEGPDVIGLWGPPGFTGVDPGYIDTVVERCVEAVRAAAKQTRPAKVSFGMAEDERLIGDSRLPKVKDAALRVLRFDAADGGDTLGTLVQFNSHPEAMAAKNTLITADYPATVVAELRQRGHGETVFVCGAIGGLLAPPGGGVVRDGDGNELHDGSWEYTERYGVMVADLAERALADARRIDPTPIRATTRRVMLRVDNPAYKLARAMNIVQRDFFTWTGSPDEAGEPLTNPLGQTPGAIETEVGLIRLGELDVALIPGELYSELSLGKVQTPVDPGADFPDAPIEPSVFAAMGEGPALLIGLANDEVGYIIPKRQWDVTPPYAYGRTESQYGEINSTGPEAAPILMNVFADLAAD